MLTAQDIIDVHGKNDYMTSEDIKTMLNEGICAGRVYDDAGPNRSSGYSDLFCFLPTSGRACHVSASGGMADWYDAKSIEDAINRYELDEMVN